MLMRHASVNERNAAFNAVFTELEKALTDWVPGFFQERIKSKLESPDGKKAVLSIVDVALDAAEAEREKAEGQKT